MKCFVLSLHRSGTCSTAKFLSGLGFKTKHWPAEHEGKPLQQDVVGYETDLGHVTDVISPVLESFDAVTDVPLQVLYGELFKRYPEAKFLLVYRNPFHWVESVREHYKGREFKPYVRVVYWNFFEWRPLRIDELSDAQLVWMHNQHTADVIRFFEETVPNSLGVFDLCAPDLGNKIATFLGRTATIKFPRFNARKSGEAFARSATQAH